MLVPLHILLGEIQKKVGSVTASNQEHIPPGVQSVRPACACEGHFDSRLIGVKEGNTMVAEGGYKNRRHMSG